MMVLLLYHNCNLTIQVTFDPEHDKDIILDDKQMRMKYPSLDELSKKTSKLIRLDLSSLLR